MLVVVRAACTGTATVVARDWIGAWSAAVLGSVLNLDLDLAGWARNCGVSGQGRGLGTRGAAAGAVTHGVGLPDMRCHRAKAEGWDGASHAAAVKLREAGLGIAPGRDEPLVHAGGRLVTLFLPAALVLPLLPRVLQRVPGLCGPGNLHGRARVHARAGLPSSRACEVLPTAPGSATCNSGVTQGENR